MVLLQRKELIANYFYNFLNGFLMFRMIPQMWYVLKMCLIGFIVIATTFTISYMISGEMHQIWFPIGDQTITINVTSWGIINLGAIGVAVVIVYYFVRIAMYYNQRRKLKKL